MKKKTAAFLIVFFASISAFAENRTDLAKEYLRDLSESVSMFRGQFAKDSTDIRPFGPNSFCNHVGEFQGQYQAVLFLLKNAKLKNANYRLWIGIPLCNSFSDLNTLNIENAINVRNNSLIFHATTELLFQRI